MNSTTARNYVYYLLDYLDWCSERGRWASAHEMIEKYESLDERGRYGHLDVLEEYVKSRGTGTNDRRNAWYAIRNFYDYHRLPLPRPSRSEVSGIFRPSQTDKKRALETPTLKIEEVRSVVMHAPQSYKAAVMVMFQGAMGVSEFNQFNGEVWKEAVKQLAKPEPLRINLFRSKTSRTSVKSYYTFLGEDAKKLVAEWLKMRPLENDDDYLFVTYNKNRKMRVPVTGRLVSNMIRKTARKTGLIGKNELGRYHIHAHEFRDLFKSMCTLTGVNRVASEFFLGHSIDKLGYDKSPQYDEEWFRKEYSKVEPKLNILTNPQGETYETIKTGAAIEALKAFGRMLGIEQLEIKVAKLLESRKDMTETKAIEQVVGRELVIKPIRVAVQKPKKNIDPKKIVDEEELERYLRDGWDVQTVFPSGKILIRK